MSTAVAKAPECATPEQFLWRCMNDPRFFIENCLSIKTDSGDVAPFEFNHLQNFLYEQTYIEAAPGIWVRTIFDETHLKARQFGDSTYQLSVLYHSFVFGGDFGSGFVGSVIAFADDSAAKLKEKVDLFHASAAAALMAVGIDPTMVLPDTRSVDNKHELADEERGCRLEFFSEKTKGAGRSETRNAMYVTDLSEWTSYGEVISGLGGSLSKTGREWVVRDGTGKGIGNALHVEYEKAKTLEQTDAQVRAFFIGARQCGYSKEYLDRQRRVIGDERRFRREYPETEADAFSGDANALFDDAHIKRCQKRKPKGKFLVEVATDDEIRTQCIPVYGIDSAEGTENGDYACIKVRDARTGLEIIQPWRQRSGPRAIAAACAEMHRRFPGLIAPERNNHGHATILALCDVYDLQRYIYIFDDIPGGDERMGFNTFRSSDADSSSKSIIEARYGAALEGRVINLPSENGAYEATIYGRQKNGKLSAPPGFHDDELIADMICVWAFTQAHLRHEAMRNPARPLVVMGERQE